MELALQVDQSAHVWADDTLLTRATGNLLTNAIRHARPGSTVVLSGSVTSNGGCHISVSNEGEPIALKHQARIFERAYRVESPSNEEAPGVGLGLAIVKSTMELHGGLVYVRSAPGHPTVFTLWSRPHRRVHRRLGHHAGASAGSTGCDRAGTLGRNVRQRQRGAGTPNNPAPLSHATLRATSVGNPPSHWR